jgi:uracil-DNA glycosylase
MNKSSSLLKIAKIIENCRACKRGKSGKAVIGEGDPNAKIVFIGEAPGKREAETGRPFVGRSGQLLRKLIRGIGLEEKNVYITSPVKYLPDRGTPTDKDIVHGKIHLDKQLETINPAIIVLLGKVAAKAILGRNIPVLSMHGTIIEKDNKSFFITIHPAAAIRFVKNKKILCSDFQTLKRYIKVQKIVK